MTALVVSHAHRLILMAGFWLFLAAPTMANVNLQDFYSASGVDSNKDYVGEDDVAVEPFNGRLHINHTDLALNGDGGFSLVVGRSYTSGDGALPGVSSIVGLGWTFHSGRVLVPSQSWVCGNDNSADAADNPVFEAPDGRRVAFRSPSQPSDIFGRTGPLPGTFFISTDRWIAECDSLGFSVTSPDGMKYRLEKKLSNLPEWYTTKVTDRNGNNATFRYVGGNLPLSDFPNTRPLILAIDLSDGRTVDFSYYDLTASDIARVRLKRMSFDGKHWDFSYTRVLQTDHYYLNHVQRPDGTRWQYTYKSSGPETDAAYRNVQTITSPFGKHTEFWYSWEYFTPGQLETSVVNKMVVTGDSSVPSGTWLFDYIPGGDGYLAENLDKTTVKGPTSTVAYHHFGAQAALASYDNEVWRIGLLAARFVCSPHAASCPEVGGGCVSGGSCGSAELQSETFTWGSQHLAQDVVNYPRGLIDTTGFVPYLQRHDIERDGTVYTVENQQLDDYGNITRITEEGQETRTTEHTFFTSPYKWIVNVLDQEKVLAVEQGSAVVVADRVFDTKGNPTSVTRLGVTTGFLYDAKGQIAKETNARSFETQFSNYRMGIPQTTVRAEGVIESQVVSDDGTVASRTDGRGQVTVYEYDDLFRLRSTAFPNDLDTGLPVEASIEILRAVSNYRLIEEVKLQGGLSETTEYNILGKVAKQTRKDIATGLEIAKWYHYDQEGRLLFESLPNQATSGTAYTYDALGRPLGTVFADGAAIAYEYATGNKVMVTNQRDKVQTLWYRSFGNPDERELVRVDSPLAITTTISRDRLGNVRSVQQGDINRIFKYNDHYHLIERQDPETSAIVYGRDLLGNLTSRQIATQEVTTFVYDGLNRLERTIYEESGLPDVVRGYDENSNLKSLYFGDVSRDYEYDARDRLVSETLRIAEQGAGENVFVVRYQRDLLGNVDQMIYPSGRMVDYAPDAFGRATKAAPFVTSAAYYPSGQLESLQFENGVTTGFEQWDERLWLKRISVSFANEPIVDLEFEYDGVGNLVGLEDTVEGPFYPYALTYDDVDRLQSAEGPWGDLLYSYDAVGNIQSVSLGQSYSIYHYNNANRLADVIGDFPLTYGYDGYGNVSSKNGDTFEYSEAGNLVAASAAAVVNFYYDGANQLAIRETDQKREYLFYDQSGRLLAEMDPQGEIDIENVFLNGQLVGTANINRPPLNPVIQVPGASMGGVLQGQRVAFDGGLSADPDGDPLSYTWNFGDGTHATGAQVSHVYSQPGEYVAELVVSDGEHLSTSTLGISVGSAAPSLVPSLYLLLN